jgi:hypothetical protein
MKKVLILAYDFPPFVSVGGLRPKAWFDHLKEYEIEPVVITRQWDNQHGNHLDYISPSLSKEEVIEKNDSGVIIRTAYRPNLSNRLLLRYGENKFRIFRKSITAFYEVFQFIFPLGMKRVIYRAAKDYLSKNKVDCIIATGDPYVLFLYANKLSREFKTNWIADYRDPWSHEFENHGSFFEKKWSRYLEKKIVSSAKEITTVSELLKLKITSVTGQPNIEVLPNGFDSDAIDKVKGIQQNSEVLRIGFAGSIYSWNPIDSLLQTFSDYVTDFPSAKIELFFYGVNIEQELHEKIQSNYPILQAQIQIFPSLPNEELLQKLAECNALLLFNHYAILGTKIFDYLGLKRKILLCYTDDKESKNLKSDYFPLEDIHSESDRLQEDLIKKTNSGIAIKDCEHLKTTIDDLLEELRVTGEIACNSTNTEKYSRKIQTEKLANLIKSIY